MATTTALPKQEKSNRSPLSLLREAFGPALPPELRLASEAYEAFRVGNLVDAKAKAVAAKKLEKTPTGAYEILLGQIYMAEHEFSRAIGSFDAAYQIVDDETKPTVLNNIGSAYFGWAQATEDEEVAKQHLDSSAKHLREARALQPESPEISANLIVTYNRAGDFASALKAFQSYPTEHPQVYYAHACTLALKDQAGLAIAALTRACANEESGVQLALSAVVDDDFRSLRDDEQFITLLRSRLPEVDMEQLIKMWALPLRSDDEN